MLKISSIHPVNNTFYNQVYSANDGRNISFDANRKLDTFESKNGVKKVAKTAAFGVSVGLAFILGSKMSKTQPIHVVENLIEIARKKDIPYITNLAKDISRVLNKQVNPEQLSSVMGKHELTAILPKLKKENYMAYREFFKDGKFCREFFANIKDGTFKIDLHSHTNHSDGQADVAELLDNVVQYANKFHKATGEKFIFSITDHDTISGVQKALELIVNDPKKYENLRFVPGVELSFLHHTDKGEFHVSEMLAHCINPFAKKTVNFVESLLNKREKMFHSVIKDLNTGSDTKYALSEVEGNFLNPVKDKFKYNAVYTMYNYAQIKQRLSALAKKWGKNPEDVYMEIMPQWHAHACAKHPEAFEKFMQKRFVDLGDTYKTNKHVENVFSNYLPHFKNQKAVCSSERTFEELIDHFSADNDAILGFAHPAFLTQLYENPQLAIEKFLKMGKNTIKTFEGYHQAYDIPIHAGKISQNEINKANDICEKYQLLKTGGHDNHKPTLLDN